jgi:hypothetical protein
MLFIMKIRYYTLRDFSLFACNTTHQFRKKYLLTSASFKESKIENLHQVYLEEQIFYQNFINFLYNTYYQSFYLCIYVRTHLRSLYRFIKALIIFAQKL